MKKKKTIAFIVAAAMLFSMSGCGANTERENSSTDVVTDIGSMVATGETDPKSDTGFENSSTDAGADSSGSPTTGDADQKIRITQTAAKTVQFEQYETSDFSMTIPAGWNVTTGGANINSYIYVTDPNEPRNLIFIILKMEPLLHSQAGKDVYQKLYNNGDQMSAIFANAPVLEEPSTEGLFKAFYPDFTVIERFEADTGYGMFSLGDEILRATYTEEAGPAEGVFTASVVDFGSFPVSDGTVIDYQLQTVDGGYYMAYNIMGVSAAKDTLIEWSDVLFQCMSSLKYSDSFINATNNASNDQLALSRQISQNFNESMNGIMSSWENRNRSQDIMSQKQSDATLGYERVYDTETNEIYRATNGFTDVYDGKRYQPVTDDNMYSEAISGYIEKVD